MLRKACIIIGLVIFFSSPAFGYWIWTPKTNKWINPKYASKENPKKQLEFSLEFFNNGKYEEARREFQKLIKRFPKAFEASEAQFYIGVCWEKQDKLYEAFNAYQAVVDKYPFSTRTNEVLEKQFAIGEKYLERPLSSAWQSFSGQEPPAVVIFRKIVSNAPYSKYADIAQYKVGLVLKSLERYSEAKEEFEKVINDYPQSKWVGAAKYQLALVDAKMAPKSDYSQESTAAAVQGFEEFVREYPDAELSEKAQEQIRTLRAKEAQQNFDVAKFYEKQKVFDSARIYYQYVIDKYPETPLAAKAMERNEALQRK